MKKRMTTMLEGGVEGGYGLSGRTNSGGTFCGFPNVQR